MADQRRFGMGARLLGEMAVIFLSVVLALAADDWREARAERVEAEESLAVILADLRRDSVLIQGYAELIRPRAEATARLLQDWDRTDQHPDTLDGRMKAALSGPRGVGLRRAGFEALIGSNGLRLIDDSILRARLLEYYQRDQPSFVEFAETAEDLRLQARRHVAPYAEWPVEGFREGNVPRNYLRLVAPWPRIAGDDALRHDLAWSFRMRSTLLNARIPEMNERIEDLIRVVAEGVS